MDSVSWMTGQVPHLGEPHFEDPGLSIIDVNLRVVSNPLRFLACLFQNLKFVVILLVLSDCSKMFKAFRISPHTVGLLGLLG